MKAFTIVLAVAASAISLHATCPSGTANLFPEMPATASRYELCADMGAYTAAIFGNGFDARFTVLRRENGAMHLVSASPERLFGEPAAITPIDIDADGNKEILLTAAIRGDDAAWIFALGQDGTTRLLTPGSDAGGPLTNITLLDVNGDQRLEIIDVKASRETIDGESITIPIYRLYEWTPGGFVVNDFRKITHIGVYTRGSGPPSRTEEHVVAVPDRKHRVTLLNGNDARTRCSSGRVDINAMLVFNEADFSKQATILTTEAVLDAQNVVTVELRSAPGCHIRLLIEEAP